MQCEARLCVTRQNNGLAIPVEEEQCTRSLYWSLKSKPSAAAAVEVAKTVQPNGDHIAGGQGDLEELNPSGRVKALEQESCRVGEDTKPQEKEKGKLTTSFSVMSTPKTVRGCPTEDTAESTGMKKEMVCCVSYNIRVTLHGVLSHPQVTRVNSVQCASDERKIQITVTPQNTTQ